MELKEKPTSNLKSDWKEGVFVVTGFRGECKEAWMDLFRGEKKGKASVERGVFCGT